jgi:hypothetical protein
MRYILSLLGIVGSFFMLRYRERLGDMIGEAEWMGKIGGVYNLILILSLFLFFWCIAELTNTTDILFRPLLMLFPGSVPEQTTPDF